MLSSPSPTLYSRISCQIASRKETNFDPNLRSVSRPFQADVAKKLTRGGFNDDRKKPKPKPSEPEQAEPSKGSDQTKVHKETFDDVISGHPDLEILMEDSYITEGDVGSFKHVIKPQKGRADICVLLFKPPTGARNFRLS